MSGEGWHQDSLICQAESRGDCDDDAHWIAPRHGLRCIDTPCADCRAETAPSEPTAPVPAPDAGLTEALAAALAEHVEVDGVLTDAGQWIKYVCDCGATGNDHDWHRAHVAEKQAEAVAEHVATQREAAWSEGSLAMRKARMVQGESLPQNPYRAVYRADREAQP